MTSQSYGFRLKLFCTVTALFVMPAGAQTPELNGTYSFNVLTAVAAGELNRNIGLVPIDGWKLTAIGREAHETYDLSYVPTSTCDDYPSIPDVWFGPFLNRIEQQEDRVVLRHELFDIVRIVHLERSNSLRPPGEYSPFGYSRGWYEGDTLIVETTGLLEHPAGIASNTYRGGFGDQQQTITGGLPSSKAKRVIERITSLDDGRIRVAMAVEDAIMLEDVIAREAVLSRHDSVSEIPPYNCDARGAEINYDDF